MPQFEPDTYDPRQQAAEERLRRVAVLLAAASGGGSFPTSEERLEQLVARIRDRIPDANLRVGAEEAGSPGLETVSIVAGEGGALHFSASFSRSASVGEVLRPDGRLVNGFVSAGLSFDDPEARVQLGEREQADLEEISRRLLEQRSPTDPPPPFHGEEFIATLPAAPQGQDPVQILAIELYDDGLIVHHMVRDPTDWHPIPDLHMYAQAGVEPPLETFMEKARAAGGGNLIPGIRVEDDIGTRYQHTQGSGGGGPDLHHGSAALTPGPPDQANKLRVTTYAGTVTFDLPDR